MQKHATTGNIADKVKDLEAKTSARFNAQARPASLDALSERTGTLIADALISPADAVESIEPTDTAFTGVAMGGEGWTFGGTIYNFVAVAAGVLQAGFNYLGKFIAGAGAVTLDESGLSLEQGSGTTNAIKFMDGAELNAAIYNLSDASTNQTYLQTYGLAGKTSNTFISAYKGTGVGSSVRLSAYGSGTIIGSVVLTDTSITINENGSDIDTNIKGDTTTVLTVDAGLEAVGIGGAAESGKKLKVTGAASVTSTLDVGGLQTNELGMIINNSAADSDTQIKGDTDANLIRTDASTDRVGIGTATPATKLDVSGTITGTGLIVGGATLSVIDEGTYTPSITGVTNVAASTAQTCFYMRVGTKVMVWGGASIDPTAAGNTVFGISLPVASNLALARNLVGNVGRAGAGDEIGNIEGDATNDRANVTYTAAVTTNHNVNFHFCYTII